MLNLLIRLVINAAALWLASYIVDGFEVTGTVINLIVVAIIFGLVNAIIRPIVKLLTLPINIVTLGLFTIVINVFMLYIVSWLSANVNIDGLWAALLASLVISIVSTILSWFLKDD
jgi:putative membrane protein